MLSKYRKVLFLNHNKKWQRIAFEDLKPGMIFKLINPNKKIVKNIKKKTIFTCLSYPKAVMGDNVNCQVQCVGIR